VESAIDQIRTRWSPRREREKHFRRNISRFIGCFFFFLIKMITTWLWWFYIPRCNSRKRSLMTEFCSKMDNDCGDTRDLEACERRGGSRRCALERNQLGAVSLSPDCKKIQRVMLLYKKMSLSSLNPLQDPRITLKTVVTTLPSSSAYSSSPYSSGTAREYSWLRDNYYRSEI